MGKKRRNTHYISRFLTKPWEGAERELHYYDFDSRRVERETSKTLFAEDRLNTPAAELRLNQLIETPLGIGREEIANGRNEAKDLREYRAIALMLLLQGARSAAALETRETREDSVQLERILRLTDAEIDLMVDHSLRGYQLVTYHLGAGRNLFFPATGLFAIPVFDAAAPGGLDFAACIPIGTRTFVARLAPSAKVDLLEDPAADGDYLAGLSVGLNAGIVVIPPSLHGLPEAQIGENLRHWRAAFHRQFRHMHALRSFVAADDARTGVKTDVRELLRVKVEALRGARSVAPVGLPVPKTVPTP